MDSGSGSRLDPASAEHSAVSSVPAPQAFCTDCFPSSPPISHQCVPHKDSRGPSSSCGRMVLALPSASRSSLCGLGPGARPLCASPRDRCGCPGAPGAAAREWPEDHVGLSRGRARGGRTAVGCSPGTQAQPLRSPRHASGLQLTIFPRNLQNGETPAGPRQPRASGGAHAQTPPSAPLRVPCTPQE